MSIKKAYCLQMDKLVTSSQARVSFLSSENILYDEFSFYCISCGMRLSGANVHKKEELTRKNKTSHFKKYSKDKNVKHINEECMKFNVNTTTPSTGGGKATSSGDLIVYTKFKLSQINYEIVNDLGKNYPDFLSTAITLSAVDSEIECDIHTTSILKDLVNCFNDLKEKNELENYPLTIEGDNLPNNTYSSVFRAIIEFNDKLENKRKLNEHNNNFFQFRVLYGKSKNALIKKEDIGWSFLVDFVNTYDNERYYFKETINGEIKLTPMFVRVFIPTEIVNKYLKLSNQYLIDEENKILDSFYITNCVPQVKQWNNNSGKGTHKELVFEVSNLNHIHLTFKGLEE